MIVRALVEEWPDEVSIYVHELPGVVVTEDSLADALNRLPDAIEAHLNWLAAHGFDVRSFAGLDVEIAEQLPAVEGRRGPFFEADRATLSPEGLETALQIAALARRDLVDIYRSVSEFRRDHAASPDEWSIADHLRHIAEAEAFYADHLVSDGLPGLPHNPLEALRESASHSDGILRSLSAEDRSRVFERSNEQWTATKVLRRMVGHLREHYPWIRELASS